MRRDLARVLGYPLVALAICLTSPAGAQRPITGGIARDARLGTPLQCLHVALIDSAGAAVLHGVTDADGRFDFETPGPGAFRFQFEIFGWEPLLGPVDTLRDGEFRQREFPLAFDMAFTTDTMAVAPADTSPVPEGRHRPPQDDRTGYMTVGP